MASLSVSLYIERESLTIYLSLGISLEIGNSYFFKGKMVRVIHPKTLKRELCVSSYINFIGQCSPNSGINLKLIFRLSFYTPFINTLKLRQRVLVQHGIMISTVRNQYTLLFSTICSGFIISSTLILSA